MSWHFELGNDTNASVLGVCHNELEHVDRVDLLAREGSACQVGRGFREHRERLIVREVPVKDIELGPRHGVEDLEDGAHGYVAAGGIEHQAPVRERVDE